MGMFAISPSGRPILFLRKRLWMRAYMSGFVLLHRRIQRSDIWHLKSKQILVAEVCVMNANWRDKHFMGFEVKRGQWLTHYHTIQECCPSDISLKEVRGTIRKLTSQKVAFLGMRTVTVMGRRFLLLSVLNYETYQPEILLDKETGTWLGTGLGMRRARVGHEKGMTINEEVEEVEEREEVKTKDKDICGPSHKALVSRWNTEVADRYPRISSVLTIGDKRRPHLKARYLENTFAENIDKMFEMIHASPKVTDGSMTFPGSKGPWIISFDWLIKNNTNYIKLLEGKYAEHREVDPYAELYEDAPET